MLRTLVLAMGFVISAQGAPSKQTPTSRLTAAKATVGTAAMDLKLSPKHKKLMQEEVLPYATAFLNEQEAADPHRISSYLKFSTDTLMSSMEEGKRLYPLCYRVIAPTDCSECQEAKAELLKYLPKRFSRRGFQPRPLDGSDKNFDNFAVQAFESGCVHAFMGVFSKASPERIVFSADMDVRDRGKRHFRAQTAKVEVPNEGDGVYSAAVVALTESLETLFAELGTKTSAIAAADAEGPERLIRLEQIKSYHDYMLFKKKLVDGVVGLARLEERSMGPGTIEFLVRGDVSIAAINSRLLNAIGPEPVIESHEVVNDTLLRVVLK